MKRIEAKAYQWLLKQGKSKESILFHYPDFMTVGDHEFYEVKTLHKPYGNMVTFHHKQYEDFKKIDPMILVFSEGENEPTVVSRLSDIEKKIKVYVTSSRPKFRKRKKSPSTAEMHTPSSLNERPWFYIGPVAVDPLGRSVIPKRWREQLKLNAGDTIDIQIRKAGKASET